MAKTHVPNLASNGRYRVIIGGRAFWCGKDHPIAVKLTNALDVAWDNEMSSGADGKKCWSNESINTAFALVGVRSPVATEPESIVPASSAPATPIVQAPMPKFRPAFLPTDITLHQAIDRYVEMRLADNTLRRAGEDSETKFKSIKYHVQDMPLHSIDAAAQKTITDIIKNRPPNRNLTGERKGEPISIITAKNWLQELGAAFKYFSHPDSQIGWVPPYPDWREKFYISDKQAKAIAINCGDVNFGKIKPTFNIEQLVRIWKHATERGRLYLLGGVCLGWTAMEFATLQRDQVQVDDHGDTYIICKERSKTGIPMTFWLCPELAFALKKAIAAASKDPKLNPLGLALLTRNRQGDPCPLVHRKTDTVGELWIQTVKRVNRVKKHIPEYPHSSLRRLAGQLIENLTGNHGLAQMVLSQKMSDVASTNYVGIGIDVGAGKTQLQRLWDAQREVHKALAPIFATETKQRTESSQQAA